MDDLSAWTVKDPGLGYKDYGKYCNVDALRYLCKYEGIWKGETRMGARLFVGGELYCKADDGTFTKVMTVTNIETNTTSCDDTIEVKVDGYTSKKIEKERPDDTGIRWIQSINEKWSPEDHIYFMIFDEIGASVKIERNAYDYTNPYIITVYKNGRAIWSKRYKTWRDLDCMFLYDIGQVLNVRFMSPYGDKIPRMLQNARRFVRLDMEAALSWSFKNGSYIRKELPVSAIPNSIDKVIFDDPATVILWKDGTRTVVHTQDGEPYDKEKGFAMAVCKKVFGNERDYYHIFKRWFRKGEDRSKNEDKE